MPYTDEVTVRALESRARRSRVDGQIRYEPAPARSRANEADPRSQGVLTDQTGEEIIGFARWTGTTWGG